MSLIFKPETKESLNSAVLENYTQLRLSLFIFPFLLVLALDAFLYSQDSLNVVRYVEIQKDYFYLINSKLSQYPTLIYNLTQIGDALVFFSILSPLIIYAPKLWEALLSTALVSLILSRVLKDIFAVPRPAQIFDTSSFTIIGEKLVGFSSLPSGHSITIFSTLTLVLFAFLPKKIFLRIMWVLAVMLLAILLSSTRVGVGAHHPFDVITGGVVGYISGLAGVFISLKFKIWKWINSIKYYPIFILLFLICGVVLVDKIYVENLVVSYLALTSLLYTLYTLIYVYFKK
jgi:membrane-associated phospholipid phosphatase